MTRILTFCGSSRTGSFNQRAVDSLASIATGAGSEVSSISLGDLDLPIYNGDLEEASGLPTGAVSLREKMIAAGGFIIGCPEYNGFLTPLLVNALDWASRSEEKRPDLTPFANKIVLLSSASPGGFGGMRAAGHLRSMLSGIGCIVLPQAMAVPAAHKAFNEDGGFADEGLARRATGMVDQLLDVVRRFE